MVTHAIRQCHQGASHVQALSSLSLTHGLGGPRPALKMKNICLAGMHTDYPFPYLATCLLMMHTFALGTLLSAPLITAT